MRLKPDKAKRGPGAVGPQKKYEMSFLLHYVDDFHTLGPPNSKLCQHNLDTCIEQFRSVLGIELDSLLLQAHLPQ